MTSSLSHGIFFLQPTELCSSLQSPTQGPLGSTSICWFRVEAQNFEVGSRYIPKTKGPRPDMEQKFRGRVLAARGKASRVKRTRLSGQVIKTVIMKMGWRPRVQTGSRSESKLRSQPHFILLHFFLYFSLHLFFLIKNLTASRKASGQQERHVCKEIMTLPLRACLTDMSTKY